MQSNDLQMEISSLKLQVLEQERHRNCGQGDRGSLQAFWPESGKEQCADDGGKDMSDDPKVFSHDGGEAIGAGAPAGGGD